MRIIRAEFLGMCFGVRDAIALAVEHAAAGPLTILGDLVHNPVVLDRLRENGIAVAHDVEKVRTPTVMVTAHGTSDRALATTRARGLTVVEATCPLVRVAHRAITSLIRDGYHPIIIGQPNHVEVRGLTDDLEAFDVVLDDTDVAVLDPHPRIGIAAQTTQSIERVQHLVALIRQRFNQSDVRFIDTVCRPTKDRQKAARQLARQSDVVIVIGGAHSNNTRELTTACRLSCPRVHQVQSAAELCPGWLHGAGTVGITAGTSTPDDVIDGVERRIRELAALSPAQSTVGSRESAVAVDNLSRQSESAARTVERSRREAFNGEALNREALNREALSREALSREALSNDERTPGAVRGER
jgi:4-hydroxy-3-methylbut-2-enyl diphosphate reductase